MKEIENHRTRKSIPLLCDLCKYQHLSTDYNFLSAYIVKTNCLILHRVHSSSSKMSWIKEREVQFLNIKYDPVKISSSEDYTVATDLLVYNIKYDP